MDKHEMHVSVYSEKDFSQYSCLSKSQISYKYCIAKCMHVYKNMFDKTVK